MNIRLVGFMVIAALTAAGGWALLVHVEDPQPERAADADPAAHRPVSRPSEYREGTSEAETPEPARASNGDPAQVRDWTRRFHESTDAFSLARDLVPAALNGEGAAQQQLGKLLLQCEVYKRILAPYPDGSVAERVEFHLASGTLTEQARSQFRQGALRCERLFKEDPFAGYDVPDEARDFGYWARQAVESGEPVAVINRVFDAATSRGSSDAAADQAFHEAALSDLRGVVFSGNGAALYALGGMLSHPSVAADPEDGYAWIVAACASGYDCSNANPDIGFGCVERGSCDRGSTFLDVLQRDLGAGKYATIYAKAQDIQYKIQANDWEGLQPYLEIK